MVIFLLCCIVKREKPFDWLERHIGFWVVGSELLVQERTYLQYLSFRVFRGRESEWWVNGGAHSNIFVFKIKLIEVPSPTWPCLFIMRVFPPAKNLCIHISPAKDSEFLEKYSWSLSYLKSYVCITIVEFTLIYWHYLHTLRKRRKVYGFE